MSPKLKAYLVAVHAIALLVLAVTFPYLVPARWGDYAAWIAIELIVGGLWLPTMSGTGTVTMASSTGLATVMLWGMGPACWIITIGTLLAELLLLKKPLIRASFNSAQIAITVLVAGWAFGHCGGPILGLASMSHLNTGAMTAFKLAPAVLVMFAAYLAVNRALVAVAVSWSTDRPYFKVLREDWFYTERLIEDGAAFLLSPLMVLSFQAIGYVGAGLFYVPLRLFNESHRRYLELQKAQRMLIYSERMAAKGELSAEIGHELRNILTAITSQAQMISKEAEKESYTNLPRRVQTIKEQSKRMETMSRGLMDFSHSALEMERVDVNALLGRTIELVSSTNRFDGVEWETHFSELAPELRADPGQLQQVVLNLLNNAADAMNEMHEATAAERRPKRLIITTLRDDATRQVTIQVADTGPGIPPSNLARIFDPQFTTKPTGHGFGLSTSYRIIENHKGRIAVASPSGEGACFTLTLPMQGQGTW